jgi:glutathione S-transferase
MGLPYRLRPVDLLGGVEKDPEFLAINPAGFIPAIRDGDVTMVESIAIMEYLMARHGPTPLAPEPNDPAFLHTNSSCTAVKPASRPPFTSSSVPAILRPRPSGETGAPGRHRRCSTAAWGWCRGNSRARPTLPAKHSRRPTFR